MPRNRNQPHSARIRKAINRLLSMQIAHPVMFSFRPEPSEIRKHLTAVVYCGTFPTTSLKEERRKNQQQQHFILIGRPHPKGPAAFSERRRQLGFLRLQECDTSRGAAHRAGANEPRWQPHCSCCGSASDGGMLRCLSAAAGEFLTHTPDHRERVSCFRL